MDQPFRALTPVSRLLAMGRLKGVGLLLAAATLCLAGCAGYRMKTDDLVAQAWITITDARRSGAEQFAAPTLAAAEARLLEARRALAEDDFETSRRAALDARSLAELAAVQSRTAQGEADLRELEGEIAQAEATIPEEPAQ